MKKLILSLALILVLSTPTWLASCEGGNTAMNATQTVAVDLEAMLASLGSILFQNPCALTSGMPTGVYVGAAGSFGSGRAAILGGRPDMAYTHSSPDLPSTYLVAGNPFEEYGIIHNRGINLIISSGGSDSTVNKVGRNDSTFFMHCFL